MNNNTSLFKLLDIANWVDKGFVELPKVQRGFVWRPYQIEDLWDSLLRKYPIGSFVFNKQKDGKLQLLDGQQRATAITLGFANKIFRNRQKHIKIFIDLELPTNDARKYYFRVITDSHPWGYQKKSNNKPLESNHKRDAMKYWNDVDLINPDLYQCFPYDASLPVPLSFFLDATNQDELYHSITNWSLWEKATLKLEDYIKNNPKLVADNSATYLLHNDVEFKRKQINTIYADIQKMLSHHEIPGLYLEDVLESKNPAELEHKSNANNNEQEHEIENLFVRLNAGGTPLRGEELNYSILKSKIDSKIQDKIEETCDYFVSPSRFITVAFRLYQYSNKKYTGRDSLSMNIRPRQFQSRLNKEEDVELFTNFLIELLEKKEYNGQTLIDYSKYILEYEPNINPSGFPHLVAKKLINNSPELLFMFWYRIVIKKDRFQFLTEKDKYLHRQMLGMYSMFYWLGKGGSNRDHSKLLRNIWPAMKVLNTETYWSSATVRRAMLNEVLLPIPWYSKNTIKEPGIKWFTKQNPNLKTSILDKLYRESDSDYNAIMLFFNTDLVLYAQRDFLYHIFKNKQFHLDDTNLPFDWDHIYPSILIEKKRNPPRRLKEIYNSIGNFRAWPYELNRMDSDDAPKKKFNPLPDIKGSSELRKSWQRFIDKHPSMIADINELPSKLRFWSYCDPKWANSEVEDIKKGDTNEVFNLIVNRGVNIIGNWYTKLHIEDLIPLKSSQKSSIVEQAFLGSKINPNPSWLKQKEHREQWDSVEMKNLIFNNTLSLNGNSLNMFISFSKNKEEQLNESDFYFGFYDKEKVGIFDSMKVSDDSSYDLNRKEYYLQGYFTLVSEHEESVRQLFVDIAAWINHKQFPLKKYRNEIMRILSSSLKAKFNSCFK